MKKMIHLLSTAIVLSLIANSIHSWSLNPLTWIKGENVKVCQKALEEKVSVLEKEYSEFLDLIAVCDINTSSSPEECIKQIEMLQERIIDFVKQNHEAKPIVIKRKKDIEENLHLEYPCLTYQKKLSHDIIELEKVIEKYQNIDERYRDKELFEKAVIFLVNLKLFHQLIVYSQTFARECSDYSDKYADYNKRLDDITALMKIDSQPKVTASIS